MCFECMYVLWSVLDDLGVNPLIFNDDGVCSYEQYAETSAWCYSIFLEVVWTQYSCHSIISCEYVHYFHTSNYEYQIFLFVIQ